MLQQKAGRLEGFRSLGGFRVQGFIVQRFWFRLHVVLPNWLRIEMSTEHNSQHHAPCILHAESTSNSTRDSKCPPWNLTTYDSSMSQAHPNTLPAMHYLCHHHHHHHHHHQQHGHHHRTVDGGDIDCHDEPEAAAVFVDVSCYVVYEGGAGIIMLAILMLMLVMGDSGGD